MENAVNKKVLLIHHRVDYDGIFSAVVCNKYFTQMGYEVIPFGYNYGDNLYPENILNILDSVDCLCMVDASYPPKDMLDLSYKFKDNFIWIDHHETAINDSRNNGYDNLPGIRQIGIAACELCWKFFFPNTLVPDIIQYCSAYDVWNKCRFSWDDVLNVQYSLKSKYGVSYQSILKNSENLLYLSDLDELINDGKLIKDYLERSWKSACNVYSFEILIDNKYRGICILGTEFSSNIFNSISDKYDLMCVCNRKGPDTYNISMYGEADKLDRLNFSAGKYMKEHYRGGGHKCAAGGLLNFDEFWRLIVNCVL